MGALGLGDLYGRLGECSRSAYQEMTVDSSSVSPEIQDHVEVPVMSLNSTSLPLALLRCESTVLMANNAI